MKISLAVIGALVAIFVLTLSGYGVRYCNRALTVASEELDPRTLLRRYEWFKDAAAQCEKKQADVRIYESRLKQLMADYAGKPRSEWSRQDREQYNIWLSETTGIQSSYNTLAAEYNAAMAKINYAFTNIGQLPRGADRALPREFKPYTTELP